MSDKNNVAFIVEGEAREPLIIKNIKKVFFKHANFKIRNERGDIKTDTAETLKNILNNCTPTIWIT